MVFAVLGTAVLFAAPLLAQEQSQESVADAARKARSQKKPATKTAKVVTNDDLKGAKPAAGEATTGAGAAPAQGGTGAEVQQAGESGRPAAGADAGAGDKKSETYWRKKFSETRESLARAQKELDILQREFSSGQTQYYPDPSKALNEQLRRKDLNDKQTKIDAKKKEISALIQKLDDLEDEMRKSGGDSGWARP